MAGRVGTTRIYWFLYFPPVGQADGTHGTGCGWKGGRKGEKYGREWEGRDRMGRKEGKEGRDEAERYMMEGRTIRRPGSFCGWTTETRALTRLKLSPGLACRAQQGSAQPAAQVRL